MGSAAAAAARAGLAARRHRGAAERAAGHQASGRGATTTTLLFVYGTLKRGFHWHSKFLSHGASFVGEATTTRRFPEAIHEVHFDSYS
jgi:hypothetical protein